MKTSVVVIVGILLAVGAYFLFGKKSPSGYSGPSVIGGSTGTAQPIPLFSKQATVRTNNAASYIAAGNSILSTIASLFKGGGNTGGGGSGVSIGARPSAAGVKPASSDIYNGADIIRAGTSALRPYTDFLSPVTVSPGAGDAIFPIGGPISDWTTSPFSETVSDYGGNASDSGWQFSGDTMNSFTDYSTTSDPGSPFGE